MQFPVSSGKSTAPATDSSSPFTSRILIAKWDMLTADILCRLAREAFPGAEVTLCRTGADTLDTLRRRPASLGIFGLTLPDIDGLDLLTLVADEHLAQRRMIVTGRRDEYSRQAVKATRVHGVFDTSTEGSELLVEAIRRVGNGGDYFSARLGETRSPFADDPAARVLSLSFVEQQVFAIMLEEKPDEEIARRLGMPVATVSAYRANIMRKLNVQSIDELPAVIPRGSRWK